MRHSIDRHSVAIDDVTRCCLAANRVIYRPTLLLLLLLLMMMMMMMQGVVNDRRDRQGQWVRRQETWLSLQALFHHVSQSLLSACRRVVARTVACPIYAGAVDSFANYFNRRQPQTRQHLRSEYFGSTVI